MRKISASVLIEKVKTAIIDSNSFLDSDTLEALKAAKNVEKSEMGLYVLDEILENADVAREDRMPLCQDTGVSVFFVRWGNQCLMEEMSLQQALDEAVREAYKEGYLRRSILRDPIFERVNTGDNTPAFIHLEQVDGDQITIDFLAKGAGADNASRMTMLMPSDGLEGVERFVMSVCEQAGADSCPPWIVGIGVGGTFDTVGGLAKHSLLRSLESKHVNPDYALLEEKLLRRINDLGIGPQGLGGRVTALACFIESRPCHAASLPVAVNIQCHSNRKAQIVF
jgi:fumarate hydratase subunit alpha